MRSGRADKEIEDRYVAFLRGINLGGRRIKNDELRLRFEELGFGGVSTFRASGNVIFSARREKSEAIVALLEEGLEGSLGYGVPVFLRSAAEVVEIAEYVPFDPDLVEPSAGKLQVTMLLEAPAAKAREQVLAMGTDEDRLAICGRELYWLPSGGILDSRLDTKAIDGALGLATQRTKGTIDLIAAKHFPP
jgi:uncharacterized protein (DUF1697 family)